MIFPAWKRSKKVEIRAEICWPVGALEEPIAARTLAGASATIGARADEGIAFAHGGDDVDMLHHQHVIHQALPAQSFREIRPCPRPRRHPSVPLYKDGGKAIDAIEKEPGRRRFDAHQGGLRRSFTLAANFLGLGQMRNTRI